MYFNFCIVFNAPIKIFNVCLTESPVSRTHYFHTTHTHSRCCCFIIYLFDRLHFSLSLDTVRLSATLSDSTVPFSHNVQCIFPNFSPRYFEKLFRNRTSEQVNVYSVCEKEYRITYRVYPILIIYDTHY